MRISTKDGYIRAELVMCKDGRLCFELEQKVGHTSMTFSTDDPGALSRLGNEILDGYCKIKAQEKESKK